jgi:hypothetical protein
VGSRVEGISLIQNFDGIQKASQENIDLMMKSYGSIGQSLQAIAVEAADYSRKNFEAGSAALERVLSATSVDKAVEAQGEYVKATYESYLGQVSKMGTMLTEMTRETYKPFEGLFGKFPK